MGPLKSPFLSPSAIPPPAPTPTSPPSTSPPPLRHHRLPPPPPPPLPQPPPLPLPPPPPPLSSYLPLPSTSPPLPLPCRAPRMLPRHGTPPGPGAAPASGPTAAVLALSSPSRSRCGRGGHSVEHVVPARGLPMRRPICVGVSREDLAGVPPEMLPPKKRLVRYHPYEAASTIQEMAASHGRGGFGNRPVLLAVEGDSDAGVRGDDGRQDRDDGLRAELLRLRISRPAMVLTKRLTPSDRSRDKARLVLPDSMVRASPLLNMLTAGERHLVFSGERGGLPVSAFDRLGRPYRMALKRDRLTCRSRSYRLTGQWSLFLSRHAVRDGDTVEVLAFRPSAWQARLDRCGQGGLGMALLHRRNAGAATTVAHARDWSSRESDAADGLLLLAGNCAPGVRSPQRRRRRPANHNPSTGP